MESLPLDLVVHNIIPRLDLVSRFRLAALSKQWRFIVSLRAPPTIPDMPWICGFTGRPRQIPSLLNFNSCLPSPTMHRPSAPLIRDPFFCPIGAFDGCVVLRGWETSGIVISLYNPFSGGTREVIPQPAGPLPKLVIATKIRILAATGLVVIMDHTDYLLVCRLGHFDWVELPSGPVCDLIFHKGELIFTRRLSDTIFAFSVEELIDNPHGAERKIIYCLTDDIGSPFSVPWFNTKFDFIYDHLVECGGELLVVTRWGFRQSQGPDRVYFLVRKLDFSQEHILASGTRHVPLAPVDDLGDSTLFITESYSLSWSGTIKDPSGFFAENCIYFVHHRGKRDTDYKIGKFAMGWTISAIFHPHIVSNLCPFWLLPRFRGLRDLF